MKATRIAAHETSFDNNGIDSAGRKHSLLEHSIVIPGGNQTLEYVGAELRDGDESFFYHEKSPKDQIVLHQTAGYLKGDIAALTKKNNHVSVPFVIGRNGTVYNLFHSGYWSYHLGRGAVGGNTTRSKSSIAIELSNIGPLKLKPRGLYNVYGGLYCGVEEKEFYTKLKEPYRGYQYFATLTAEQYSSLRIVLRYLTARYRIPGKFLPESSRYETRDSVKKFRGIVSHVNYRRTGKWDIGPAFKWSKLVGADNRLK